MKKLLIIGPEPFFVLADCPNSLKTEIPYHQKPLNAGLGTKPGGNSHHASVVSGQSKGSALKKNERGHGSTKHLIVQASTKSFLDRVLRWALFMIHNLRFCAVLTAFEFISCKFYKYCIVARKSTPC